MTAVCEGAEKISEGNNVGGCVLETACKVQGGHRHDLGCPWRPRGLSAAPLASINGLCYAHSSTPCRAIHQVFVRASNQSERYFDGFEYFLHDIVSRHAIEHSLYSLERAAPLQTALILWCCDYDPMRVYLASSKGYHRGRNVVESVERCEGTTKSATSRR